MAKRSGWLNIPLMVVRHEWPHSSGATDPESIRSKIIVTWERWPDASLPLSSRSFFGVAVEYRPHVEADDPIIAASNWHHLRTSIVAFFRHECWNGISSNPSAETMARLVDEASSEPTFPAQHTAEQLEAARQSAASDVQTAMALFLASLPNMLEVEIKGKSALDAKRLAFNDTVRRRHKFTNYDEVTDHWNASQGETMSAEAMKKSCQRARKALKQG